jgi:hypothetical protein
LRRAAKAVGLSKATFSRAVRSGKLSATGNEDGSLDIDPAELHRVFPPKWEPDVSLQRSDPASSTPEIRMLREMLAMQEGVISDLRQRLDESERERRAMAERLLPDMRPWVATLVSIIVDI